METRITGASDDLIELEGQITEEFTGGWYDDAKYAGDILAFSDGTLLEVLYDSDGIWRVKRLAEGACDYSHTPGSVAEDRPDVAVLRGDLRWVVKSERGQYSPHIVKQAGPLTARGWRRSQNGKRRRARGRGFGTDTGSIAPVSIPSPSAVPPRRCGTMRPSSAKHEMTFLFS
jgi:hypothetical protein